jgi:hypothetical protein
MKNDLTKANTPEEAELTKKKVELDGLSQVLAEKELNIEEIKLAVAQFKHRYFSEVGRKYVELDDLLAQIADLKSRQQPQNQDLKQEAVTAKNQARNTKDEYEDIDIEAPAESLKSEESEDAKKLYRRVASIIHPDMATDEESHNLRTRLMAELNEAYAKKDISKMREIFDQWQESPETVSGEGTAAELVRTIRAIAQIKRRISEIEDEVLKIMESDIYVLMEKVNDADLAGRDILLEMSVSIDRQIQDAQNILSGLTT